MAKKLQLQVPTPCYENWETMTQSEKGRFCASCQKQVIDFSNRSDREIAMFFKKPSTGSVCGRFMEDQLNRDIEIPKKRTPWLKYFFHIAIPAFLASCDNRMQGKVKVTGVPVIPKLANDLSKEICATTVGYIMPEIILEKDTAASLQHKHPQKKSIILPELKLPNINEPLFTSSEINSTVHNPIAVSQTLEGYAGVVVITTGEVTAATCDSKKAIKPVSLFRKIFKDTGFQQIQNISQSYPIKFNPNDRIEPKTIWRSSPSAVQSIRANDTLKKYIHRRKSKTIYDGDAIDHFGKLFFETNQQGNSQIIHRKINCELEASGKWLAVHPIHPADAFGRHPGQLSCLRTHH